MSTSTAPSANGLLMDARRAKASPTGSGRPMSRQELAEAVAEHIYAQHGLHVSIDDGYIGKLERGEHRWPTARYREALCHVLGVPDPSALGFHIIRGHRHQPSPDATAADECQSSDDLIHSAGHWLELLKMFVSWTDSHNTSQLLRAGETQTHILQTHLRSLTRPPSLMLTAQARWFEFLSWAADNSLRDHEAARWIEQARDLALAATDTRLASYTLMRQAQQCAEHGRGVDAVDLAIKARRHSAAAPRTHALAYVREAHGHALLGDGHSAYAAIRHAHRVAGRTSADDEADLDHHCTPQYIDAYDAYCHLLLGQPDLAARQLEVVVAGKPPTSRHDEALYRAWLSHAYRQLRRTDEAIDQYQQVYALASATGSARVLRALHTPTELGLRSPSPSSATRRITARRQTATSRRRFQAKNTLDHGFGVAG
ncbi:tetratricopeptide (TPR) repeat protein [Hamadaea flava]|uniref:XRE family transcriptional regulator n=1 Tax=Hamadaea flava TaxID=1742688 RepID=A0ABV8LMV3_9ACTN|nr:hypothetical protein [Hamadaea flava]MCP2323548.1 tetratricopeptide (TPR) repeat protein [Hamadaea flava]